MEKLKSLVAFIAGCIAFWSICLYVATWNTSYIIVAAASLMLTFALWEDM